MQGAVAAKENKFDKEDFIKLSDAVWDTLELNDMQKLKKTLRSYMIKDVENSSNEHIIEDSKILKKNGI